MVQTGAEAEGVHRRAWEGKQRQALNTALVKSCSLCGPLGLARLKQ